MTTQPTLFPVRQRLLIRKTKAADFREKVQALIEFYKDRRPRARSSSESMANEGAAMPPRGPHKIQAAIGLDSRRSFFEGDKPNNKRKLARRNFHFARDFAHDEAFPYE